MKVTSSRALVAVFCALTLVPGNAFAIGQTAQASVIPPDQLDSLVAPIALYPDPLLAQTLAASTYPLELMQLSQWLARNSGLKDQALADAVEKQPWDPSVQAMALLPDVVKRLVDDIQWTTDLGNAFLAQQSGVMDAVQRMRRKAEQTGSLKSTPQQTVQTEVVENKSVVVIEQASPDVVYVPSYNPVTVYGPPVYPYPPIYYPPAGYYAAGAAISFGVGVAMGAAWGGGWGWGAGWGRGDLTINNFNNFNRNFNQVNRAQARNTWQHNAQHRGGTPYRDQATANRFGGTTRGDSLANRQAGARQQLGSQGGNLRSSAGTSGTRAAGAAANRATGTTGNLANRAQSGNLGNRSTGTTGNLGNRAQTGSLGSRSSSSSVGSRGTSGSFGGSADRVGSRDLSRGSGGGAFGGGSDRYSGSSARASGSRGSSSVRSSSGGFSGGSRSGSFGGGSRSFGGGGGGRSRGGGGRSRGGGRR